MQWAALVQPKYYAEFDTRSLIYRLSPRNTAPRHAYFDAAAITSRHDDIFTTYRLVLLHATAHTESENSRRT